MSPYDRLRAEGRYRERVTAHYHAQEQEAWERYKSTAADNLALIPTPIESEDWGRYLSAREAFRAERDRALADVDFILDLEEGTKQ